MTIECKIYTLIKYNYQIDNQLQEPLFLLTDISRKWSSINQLEGTIFLNKLL